MEPFASNLILIAIIAIIVIPAPLFIILHFITRWKQSREISGGDEKMLEDLWQMSLRIEERLESLETILDNRNTDWSHEHDEQE